MNVKAILDEYHIEVVRVRGINLDCCCPFHKDGSPSFSIRSDDGRWLCRSGCGEGDAVGFIKKLLDCSLEEAKRRLDLISDPHDELRRKISRLKGRVFSETEDDDLPSVRLPPSSKPLVADGTDEVKQYLGYWASRGLTHEHAFNLGVKYCTTGKYAERVIIPVEQRSRLVGFVARSINRSEEKRFLNSTSTQFTQILYGFDSLHDKLNPHGSDRANTPLVIVSESIFDCITLLQWQFPAVCTFGAKISYQQISLLTELKPKKVCIAFHNDKAGIRAAMSKLDLMSQLFDVSVLRLPEDRDINEMTMEDFAGCLDRPEHKPLHVDKLRNSIQWKMQRFLNSPRAH